MIKESHTCKKHTASEPANEAKKKQKTAKGKGKATAKTELDFDADSESNSEGEPGTECATLPHRMAAKHRSARRLRLQVGCATSLLEAYLTSVQSRNMYARLH